MKQPINLTLVIRFVRAADPASPPSDRSEFADKKSAVDFANR